jgi:hypothetical protein
MKSISRSARSWNHYWWYALLAIPSVSCTRDRFARGDREVGVQPSDTSQIVVAADFPRKGCIRDVRLSASLDETMALAPIGLRPRREAQDERWEPDELSDIDATSDIYAVVDRVKPSVSLMSAVTFARRWELGRRGDGPGELREPVMVRFDPRGDALWVYDVQRQKLIAYDFSGRFVREQSVPVEITSFAIANDGSILVAPLVIATARQANSVVVGEISPTGGNLESRYSLPSSALFSAGFVLPGPNRPRIKLIGNDLALWLPESGGVTILARNERQLSERLRVQGCMTKDLAVAYQRQFESKKRSQASVQLVTDITTHGDTLFLLGGVKDAEGRYGIERFLLSSGQFVGAVAAKTPRSLPSEVRFQPNDWSSVVAVDSDKGFVANLKFRLSRR